MVASATQLVARGPSITCAFKDNGWVARTNQHTTRERQPHPRDSRAATPRLTIATATSRL